MTPPETTRAAAHRLRRRHLVSALAAALLLVSPGMAAPQDAPAAKQNSPAAKTPAAKKLTKEARLAFIKRAQVWAPTEVATMDLRAGPQGLGAFPPNGVVTCDHVFPKKRTGSSKKFECAIGGDDVVKVRYGDENGEVEGSVLATRLLWALGFFADRVYPVRVLCRGCSPDPWTQRKPVEGEQAFDPAVIERKPGGHEIEPKDGDAGWSWEELSLVDQAQGGATLAQIDALKLLAVLMQHTDTKPQQQRLLCLPGGLNAKGACAKPALALHDVGLTFGHANLWNSQPRSSVNFAEWDKTPVWRDRGACIGHMSKSHTGTLGNPKIGEAGRAFLADLLVQLSDKQLRDLFDVSRVERRRVDPQTPGASVDQWVATFKRKRDEIVTNHCP